MDKKKVSERDWWHQEWHQATGIPCDGVSNYCPLTRDQNSAPKPPDITFTRTTEMVPSLGLPGVEPNLVLNTMKFKPGDKVRVTVELLERRKERA